MYGWLLYTVAPYLASPKGLALAQHGRNLAIATGAAGILGWAGSNVFQTFKIGSEGKAQLAQREKEYEFDIQKYYDDIEREELSYERDIEKIGLVAASDLAQQQFQSSQQSSEMNFEIQMQQAKQQQLAQDRSEFLKDTAFKVQSKDQNKFGESEPMQQVAYILTELQKLRQTNSPDLDFEDQDFFTSNLYEDEVSGWTPTNAAG